MIERPELELTHFHGLVTVAPQMNSLFDLIRRVARTDSNVLVRGHTGTGKELVARALHEESPRSAGPFRAVNCATLTSELLASELFGHVKGAFTGAIKDRQGLFQLANGGTVFLDEISEIDVDIQARLLRVLQERTFTPLGGTTAIEVDVRVISASNQALRERVQEGRFREDLMYRIRVVPIFIPTLIERSGDVEALFWHFVGEFNTRGFRRVTHVSEEAWAAIQRYDWPGNVRELRNVVEFAFAVGEGSVLTIDELTPELRGEEPPSASLRETAESQERRRILHALNEAAGNRQKAADLLNMSRSTLWRKMKLHRIG